MNYKEKIKHAEIIAKDLLNEKSLEEIQLDLKEKGLYESDINKVIVSARNIIGDQLRPSLRTKLLAKEEIRNAKEFEKLDSDTLDNLIKQETQSIANDEKRKVADLINQWMEPEDIYKAIRLDFYPKEKIDLQIANYKNKKELNSGGGGVASILAGLVLMGIGIFISYGSMLGKNGGYLFYGLIFTGLAAMIRGFIIQQNK